MHATEVLIGQAVKLQRPASRHEIGLGSRRRDQIEDANAHSTSRVDERIDAAPHATNPASALQPLEDRMAPRTGTGEIVEFGHVLVEHDYALAPSERRHARQADMSRLKIGVGRFPPHCRYRNSS
jgi:hypothetical protein